MLKIFLTGDNHIGLKYNSHEQAEELKKRRISAFESMVTKANEEDCNLFVIAGDLFQNVRDIAKRDIQVILGTLSGFRGSVAILPGNHDFYSDDVKLWQDFRKVMYDYDNLLLLSEYKPYTVTFGEEEAVLYPALCTTLHSAPGENNLTWIKEKDIPQDGRYHIGIAHGAVEGETIDSEGAYFLMRRDELKSIGVDAWLIGHTHVPFPNDLKQDEYSTGETIFNAGTHVQTDVNCNTDGECFIITIDEHKTVRSKKYISGNLHFCRMAVSVSADRMEEQLTSALRELPDDSVVDLILSGSVSAEEYENRFNITEDVLGRFLEHTCDLTDLSRRITKEQIEAEYPETSFAAHLLTALLDEPKEAQLIYDLLNAPKGGKRK